MRRGRGFSPTPPPSNRTLGDTLPPPVPLPSPLPLPLPLLLVAPPLLLLLLRSTCGNGVNTASDMLPLNSSRPLAEGAEAAEVAGGGSAKTASDMLPLNRSAFRPPPPPPPPPVPPPLPLLALVLPLLPRGDLAGGEKTASDMLPLNRSRLRSLAASAASS